MGRIVSKRANIKKKEKKYYGKKKPWHTKQYGTSKLEEQFARDFLDKLEVPYKWQFEAKDIGRFFDFRIEQTFLTALSSSSDSGLKSCI